MATERRTVKNSGIRIVSGCPIVCPNLPSASPIPVNGLKLYPIQITFFWPRHSIIVIQREYRIVTYVCLIKLNTIIFFSGVCEPWNDPKCAGKNDFLQCDFTSSCNLEGGKEFERRWDDVLFFLKIFLKNI